jgi:hypothetical protein
VICGTGGAGDGLGACDGDATGDEGDEGLVAVGDAGGAGDLDGDGEVLLGGVTGDVRVSIAGTMSAGTGPGKALGDVGALAGDTDGDVPGDEAVPVDAVARAAATLCWSAPGDGCLAAPDKARLTAADAARTLAVTPAATSGRHQRRRDVWSRAADRAVPDQVREEAGRAEAD